MGKVLRWKISIKFFLTFKPVHLFIVSRCRQLYASQEKELAISSICTFKCYQPFPLIYYIKLLMEKKTGFTCIHIKNISATNFFRTLKIWLSSLSLSFAILYLKSALFLSALALVSRLSLSSFITTVLFSLTCWLFLLTSLLQRRKWLSFGRNSSAETSRSS